MGGGSDFEDEAGKTVHYLARGKAWDSEEEPTQVPVYKRVVRDENGTYLLEWIPWENLSKMTFPVTIDYIQRTNSSVGNKVWDRHKTWWVSSEYTINNGDDLVIEPGTVVKIGNTSTSNVRIKVQSGGRVIAVGEPYDPIFITSYADDGYGEDIDTGQGGLPSEATPDQSDYYSAFYFNAAGTQNSEIRNCRIRYALYGLYSLDTVINTEVRDNVFCNCNQPVHQERSSSSYASTGTYVNNLIYDCSYGFVIANYGYYTLAMTATLRNNTVDSVPTYGVLATCSSGYLHLTMTAQNNVVTNAGYGFRNYPNSSRVQHSAGTLSNNGFAYISTALYYGGAFSGSSDVNLGNNSPYVTSSNSDYYLEQSTGFIDGGASSASGGVPIVGEKV